MKDKDLYCWITDTHLDKLSPWKKYSFLLQLKQQEPKGIFLTGDISTGPLLSLDLWLLSKVGCPIYFVLGNHDYHFSSIEKTHAKIRKLCAKYPNLIWMQDQEVIGLDDEIALIGAESWYSVDLGNPKWIKYTMDWWLIKDFRQLPSMEKRIEAFRSIADESCKNIERKLEKAIEQDYKTIYILSHYPVCVEATRSEDVLMSSFWLPYDTNIRMGKTVERVMSKYKTKNARIFCGHSHQETFAQISRNVWCQVGRGRYIGVPHSQKIYL
jgi:3',5'-cyclic-AMP phosphodiesterase